jgi:hypothetical protein
MCSFASRVPTLSSGYSTLEKVSGALEFVTMEGRSSLREAFDEGVFVLNGTARFHSIFLGSMKDRH